MEDARYCRAVCNDVLTDTEIRDVAAYVRKLNGWD